MMEEEKKDTKVKNKKSNKKSLVITLIIILVIILGTIGVLAYINGTNDEKRASEIFGDEYCCILQQETQHHIFVKSVEQNFKIHL